MISIKTKRDLLADYCAAVLNAHNNPRTLFEERRYRRETEPVTTRLQRAEVMGDPVFYLEVFPSGGPVSTVDVDGGKAIQATHPFAVSVFYQYEDNMTDADSTEDAFLDLMEQAGATPGLVTALMETTELGTGDDRCVLFQPQNVQYDVIPLDDSAAEAAHLATFTIEIEG